MASKHHHQESGTVNPILTSTENFDHDADTLLLQAEIAKEAVSVLRRCQKKIDKRQQQTTSINLQKCIEKYNSCLGDIRDAINRIQDILSDGGLNEMKLSKKSEFLCPLIALKRERDRPPIEMDSLGTPEIQCMMCIRKDSEIKKLQDELERMYTVVNRKRKTWSHKGHRKLRDNIPNIIDLSDQLRPTKIAEKMSELYDNEWTDAYSVLEEQGLGEKQIIELLLDMFMAAYTECSKLASENFLERAQRCIEIPAEGFQLPVDYKVVMPNWFKQQVKEFRKARACHVVKEIEMIVMKRIKSEHQDLKAVSVYLSHCIDIAWFCAIQDPPLLVGRDAPVMFDTNTYKDYTRQGKYIEFVVWPALYLHDGGALLSKGVAQGSDTTAPDSKAAPASEEVSSAGFQRKAPYFTLSARANVPKSQHATEKQVKKPDFNGDRTDNTSIWQQSIKFDKKDTIAGMSSKAPEELRNNNPNIANLCDQFRPTKIAEKMSELYDNEWTDAYSVLEEQGLGEKMIIESLLDMFMAAFKECSRLASENFFERVQRCIEIPTEGRQPTNYKVVMPDQLKLQVKEFRKTRARFVIKEIEPIVMKRIQIENQEAVSVYLTHCIQIAWFCAVQDPPLVVRRDAPVKFDTNTYKDYTKRGKYTEFVVWPALYLHDGGALLSKGVAQGTDTTAPYNVTASKAQHVTKIQVPMSDFYGDRTDNTRLWLQSINFNQKDTIAGMSSKAPENLRDNNPNIADLRDQFRPTKIAEKMSELFDNEWIDAYIVLEEQGLGEKQIIKSLLDMFMAAFKECSRLANENFFERVQRCIEIPTEGRQPTNYKVVMPDQLKQQVKQFRKTRARFVIKEIEPIVMKRIQIENQEAVSVYLTRCIQIAWFCAVQDPPLVVRRDAPVKFDTNTYKDYTRRGRYTEFVAWPALYLHDGGALLSKGVAQGTDTTTPYDVTASKAHHVRAIQVPKSDFDGARTVHATANVLKDNIHPGTQRQQHYSRTISVKLVVQAYQGTAI